MKDTEEEKEPDSVSLWSELKQRRITQVVFAYVAGGYLVLTAIDQVVDREVLPLVVYQVALTIYLVGILAALIIGWYHGELGEQKAPLREIVMLSAVAVIALGASGVVVSRWFAEPPGSAMEEAGLDLRRIGVLYFEDLSEGALAPVADGITEALIDQLDNVRSLDVVSRNGVLPYRDSDLRADSIARILGAGTVIEGSIEERGDELRITTRLVDGLSGADLQRTAMDVPAGDFLAARDSVVETAARLLRERLGEEVQMRELQAGTSNPEAWALVQRAERLRVEAEDDFDDGGDPATAIDAYRQIDELLASAEALDPEWVETIAARAHAAYRRGWFSWAAGDIDAMNEELEIGREHANRALQIDEDNAQALAERGLIRLFTAVATGPEEQEFDRLLELTQADLEAAVAQDPSLATAHANLSFLYAGMEAWVDAALSARRALEEDAYLRGADRIYDRLFQAQYNLEQFRDAERWCEEGRRRFPDDYLFVECRLWLMAAPYEDPEPDSAWDSFARLDSLLPPGPVKAYTQQAGRILVGGVLRRAELTDSAEAVFETVDYSESVDPQRQLYVFEAGIRATTGDPEGAIAALSRWAAATAGSTLGPGAERNWWWRELRSRDDFQPFISR